MEPHEIPEILETTPQEAPHEPLQPEEGDRMKMLRRVLVMSVPVLLVVGVAVGLLVYSPASDAKPTISWEPSSLYQSVGAGESTMTSATFTASKNAGAVTVRVVPELEEYVSVEPTSFAGLSKGSSYTIDVTFAAPVDELLGVYDGTIQIREGKKNLAKPLPVSVEVVWPTFDGGEELGFSIQYPPGWYLTKGKNGCELAGVTTDNTPKYYMFRVLIKRNANPYLLPMFEWFDQDLRPFLDGRNSEPLSYVFDGHEAITLEIAGNTGSYTYVYVAKNADIVEIVFPNHNEDLLPTYESILASVLFSD